MDILDANHFTDGADGTVAHQAVTLRLLLHKDLSVPKLAEEVVENWKGEMPEGKYTLLKKKN